MHSWIEIDADAFRRNLAEFRRITPEGASIMTVVKANAYGHGLRELAPIAAESGAWLGVNSVAEAVEASSLGVEQPIAILGHSDPADAETIVRNHYRQVLYRLDVARALSDAAVKTGIRARTHLKIETGTHRQGVALDELEAFCAAVRALPEIEVEGIYTHFANIEDTLDPAYAREQLRRFQDGIRIVGGAGFKPAHIHTSATAGAILFPETAYTMVRIGIGAYGIWPSRETQLAARERNRAITLTPVMSWKTRIAQVKKVAAGEYVGYGLTYQAGRAMRVAVLPIGYFDGYDRRLSNAGRVLVQGQFAPVVGRVAMNMTMIDVTDAAAENDDEVVLLGKQGPHEIRAEELAERCGTIPYEFLCRINPQLPRGITESRASS